MRQFKLRKWNILNMALLLVVLLAGLSPTTPAHADNFIQSQIIQMQVDPADNSLWVAWQDNQFKLNFSHFGPNGQPLQSISTPFINAFSLGFAFVGSSARYYYVNYHQDFQTGVLHPFSIGYSNLTNGTTGTLTTTVDLNSCLPASFFFDPNKLIYNPIANHLYINCSITAPNSTTSQQSLIVDTAANKILAVSPYKVLEFSPSNQKLFATRTYAQPDGSSYIPTYFDLLTLDAKTEQPSASTPLLTKVGPNGDIRSLTVNSRTGQAWVVVTYSCTAKCAFPTEFQFDGNGNQVKENLSPPVEEYILLNETTNQLYGPSFAVSVLNGIIAVNAADTKAGRVATFDSSPRTIDQTHNRVYMQARRGYNGKSVDEGQGVLVMDGANLNIIQYLTLRAPDSALANYAKPIGALPANFQGDYFKETGHTLAGKFLDYWNAHGGLAVFGFPITEPFEEFSIDDTSSHIVQYFERNRFELHSEFANSPYEVELGLLGRNFSAQTGTGPSGSGQTKPINGGVMFEQTSHTLTGKFFDYWNAHGGLAVFGYPIIEPFQEVSPIDGKTYTVQYFERNRFELHPELAGTPYEVELGLLGTQVLRSRGWPI